MHIQLRGQEYMDVVFILFLVGILSLGIITSYEDIKYGKIRNRWILIALAYSVILLLCLIIFGVLKREYLINALINSGIVLLTGFIIWKIKLWSAGDAKLFFAYSLLIPLGSYSIGYFTWFPSIVLLINTFIPVFVFYLAVLLFRTSWNEKKQGWFKTNNFNKMFVLFLSLFSLSWIFNFLNISIDPATKFMILFMGVVLVEKIIKKKWVFLIAFISVLRLIFDKSVYTMQFLKTFLLLFIFFMIIRYIVSGLGEFAFTKSIGIKDLKQGMIVAEENNEKSKKTIKIHETLPFAPFIFAGALLVLLLKKDIVTWIIENIAKFI